MSELKKAKVLMKMLRCPEDCEKCSKNIQECLQDLKKSVNMLVRLCLKNRMQMHDLEEPKKETSNLMVS